MSSVTTMTVEQRNAAVKYGALWRAARCENVVRVGKYTDWMMLLVEILNGNKNAKNIWFKFKLNTDGTFNFKYRDDGEGCSQQEAKDRLLEWAAASSVNGDSIYGHGTKAFLAKSGEFEEPTPSWWKIRSRAKGANSKALNVWTGPYLGLQTHTDTEDDETFPTHGFEIALTGRSREELLGSYQASDLILKGIREIIRVRKSQRILDKITFHLEVVDEAGKSSVMDSTGGWTSYHEHIRRNPKVKCTMENRVAPLNGGKCEMRVWKYEVPGQRSDPQFHKKLMDEFPVFGDFGGAFAARVHQFNEDTMIEATAYGDLYEERKTHSTIYDLVEFVEFHPVGDRKEGLKALPQPTTTKVQYRKNTPVYREFKQIMKQWRVAKPTATKPVTPSAAAAPEQVAPVADDASSENSVVEEATNAILERRISELKAAAKSVEKVSLPKWLSDKTQEYICMDGMTPGTLQVEHYRTRVKGLKDDILKANVVLQHIANSRGLGPGSVTMKFIYPRLKTGQAKREKEIADTVKELLPSNYPFRDRITFEACK